MADEQKRSIDIPWATLLPLIAALAGVVAQLRPLTSARPTITGEKAIEVKSVQDVDARLWQDPLTVVQKAKAQLDADMVVKKVPEERTLRHQLDTLVRQVRREAEEGPLLLLAVMLDSGPYPEQAESRLRARQAVLTGMNESGWLPVDSEHIGYITVPGSPGTQKSLPKDNEEPSMLIAWEECKVGNQNSIVYPTGATHAYVLWLPSSSFNPKPLDNFARLIGPFLDLKDNVKVRLVGPANSTGLQCMLEEKKTWEAWSLPGPTREEVLARVSIVSPLATAADKELLAADSTQQSVKEAIEHHISPQTGLRFIRTIATDDRVMRALIEELALHDMHVVPWYQPKSFVAKLWERLKLLSAGNFKAAVNLPSGAWTDGDSIVILSEWDSAYGRSLTSTFEREVINKAGSLNHGSPRTARIQSFTYMHGIDGRLPNDSTNTKPKDQTQNSAAERSVAIEMTEGVDQSDFLRRLAGELKKQDTSLKQTGDRGIRAVGLLGADIFDKLMILRALRPELPEAVFFTNNYDAHFERKDDWVDVRNLIVASPFGPILKVPRVSSRPPFQQKVAPFRDNNQTSLFAGTLVATDRLAEDDIRQIESQPRFYEISREGAKELVESAPAVDSGVPGLWKEVCTVRRIGLLLAAGLAFFGIGLWFSRGIVSRPDEVDHGSLFRGLRALSHTTTWIIFSSLLIGVAVSWFAQSTRADLEPFALDSGISIWPSEMLRLIAFFLAIHFLIKAHVNLRRNEDTVNRRFHLASLQLGFWDSLRLKNLRLGLRRWKEHLAWVNPNTRFLAGDAWTAYLRRNQFWPRVIRVASLSALYLGFAACAFLALFPMPVVPGRGPIAFAFDLWVLISSVFALIVLTFYVVDAIQLNSNFIRIFTYGLTEWKPGIPPGSNRVPPLNDEEVSRYHDIVFVAQRTEVVARLIWYPLIILTLMVVARSSLFDNWSWPPGLIMIFGLNAMWAIGSAIYLRRTAEQLRGTAIENLERYRVASYNEDYKRRTFEELISDIRTLKRGAFAPLSDQPFVRAILVPSGGLGLLAVGQRLLDIF